MKNKFKRYILLVLIILCFILGIRNNMIRYNWLNSDYSDYTMHISIDDTLDLFSDLTMNEKSYTSIFDNPTLEFCKEMHNEYGAVFSFYVFAKWNGFELADSTRKFRTEFEQNADWLRFNYHAYNSKEDLNVIDFDSFVTEYDTTMNNLISIVGENAIDEATRLSRYSGNKEILTYISKNSRVFYTADDTRDSYYFNEITSKIIYDNEQYSDGNMMFMKTDFRLDNTENPYESMFDFVKNTDDKKIEVFTHEWLLKQGGLKSQSIWKIREVCKFAYYYKLRFEFC